MPFKNQLSNLKKEIDRELKEFFDFKIREIKKRRKPSLSIEMAENIRDFTLSSGKRIRPILFYYGYLLAGGNNKKRILRAAISIELIHAYTLIHDDIIDRDNLRRHRPSMHCYYKKYSESADHSFLAVPRPVGESGKPTPNPSQEGNNFKEGNNAKHFGISMAIIVGDLASVFGYEILNRADLPENLKVKAINKLNQILVNTVTGEAKDVFLGTFGDFNSAKILRMQGYKTAKYTVEGPLHLGAVLAGADDNFLKSLTDFAIPLGIAYQIKDDIIGVFGDEEKIGKPVGADIKEGKATLLIAKALESANGNQRKIINFALGNKKLKLEKLKEVRKIISETGSLEYSQNQASKFTELARVNLEKIKTPDEKSKRFLRELTDFMAGREF